MRVVIVVPSGSVPVKHTVLSRIQNLRILIRHPGRRRCRRRAENHLHPLLFAKIQECIKEFPCILALFGLKLIPGKLRNTDYLNSGFQHPVKVSGPHAAIPMLRIVIRSHDDTIAIQQIAHRLFPLSFVPLLYSFTAPAVRPDIKYLDAHRKATSSGSTAQVLASIIAP